MDPTKEVDWFWEFFGPDVCDCGQPFMPDQTKLTKNAHGRITVQCVHCNRRYSLGRRPEQAE